MQRRDTCVLTFATASGKQRTVRINSPRPNVLPSVLTNTANYMVNTNILDESMGKVIRFIGAKVVSETTTTILPAA
jgi:hypothetical protein